MFPRCFGAPPRNGTALLRAVRVARYLWLGTDRTDLHRRPLVHRTRRSKALVKQLVARTEAPRVPEGCMAAYHSSRRGKPRVRGPRIQTWRPPCTFPEMRPPRSAAGLEPSVGFAPPACRGNPDGRRSLANSTHVSQRRRRPAPQGCCRRGRAAAAAGIRGGSALRDVRAGRRSASMGGSPWPWCCTKRRISDEAGALQFSLRQLHRRVHLLDRQPSRTSYSTVSSAYMPSS